MKCLLLCIFVKHVVLFWHKCWDSSAGAAVQAKLLWTWQLDTRSPNLTVRTWHRTCNEHVEHLWTFWGNWPISSALWILWSCKGFRFLNPNKFWRQFGSIAFEPQGSRPISGHVGGLWLWPGLAATTSVLAPVHIELSAGAQDTLHRLLTVFKSLKDNEDQETPFP